MIKNSRMMIKKLRIYKNFTLILIVSFFVYGCNQMISTTLPQYAMVMGAQAALIGSVSGSFGMAALLIRPFSGQLVDNTDKQHLLSFCLSLILLSTIGLILADQIILLILFRCVNGLGWGIGSTLCMTIACGSVPEDKINSAIGLYSISQSIMQALGPSFALYLVNLYGYSMLYFCSFVFVLIALILSFIMKFEFHVPASKKLALKWDQMISRKALLPTFLLFCNGIARASITSFLVIFASSLSITNVGFYFTIQAALILICKPLLSTLADRYGTPHVLIPCELLQILSLFCLSQTQGSGMIALSAVLMGIGTSGSQPLLVGLCVKTAPPEEYGKASNTSYLGEDLAGFFGSNLCGIIVRCYGYRMMYLLFTLPVFVSLLLYIATLLNTAKKVHEV